MKFTALPGYGVVVVALACSNVLEGAEPAFSHRSAETGIIASQIPAGNFELAPMNVSPMLGGGAVGDFNNDGWQDIYVVMGGDSADRLYMNNGDGTFTDAAADAGVALAHMGIGACAGDYDNDGWLDIFVISYGPAVMGVLPGPGHHKLWHNNGDGTFTDVAPGAGVQFSNDLRGDGWGPAFGDYDLDGDLDLYVPHWTDISDTLFENNGDGTFTDVTERAGLYEPGAQGFSAKFVDMDGDRFPEILVASDFGTSRYYINNRDGTFTNHTKQTGTGLDGNGMGHAVADIDGDGRLDWYVTSIFSLDSGMVSVPGTGNFLYYCIGTHLYSATGGHSDVADGGWGWGTEAVDIDHDGLIDLAETNGWRSANGHGELEWVNEQAYLFRNHGDGSFSEIALECGFESFTQGRGLVRLDYDNDGDQDIVIFANADPVMVMRNDLAHGDDAHWLRLFFDTSANPRLAPNGYGTHVFAVAGDRTWHAALISGSTFISQSELSVHLGLGEVAMLDELRFQWADGTVTVLHDVPVDQTITYPAEYRSDLSGDGAVGLADLLILLDAWGEIDSPADLDADGIVGFADLLILLRNWNP